MTTEELFKIVIVPVGLGLTPLLLNFLIAYYRETRAEKSKLTYLVFGVVPILERYAIDALYASRCVDTSPVSGHSEFQTVALGAFPTDIDWTVLLPDLQDAVFSFQNEVHLSLIEVATKNEDEPDLDDQRTIRARGHFERAKQAWEVALKLREIKGRPSSLRNKIEPQLSHLAEQYAKADEKQRLLEERDAALLAS